MSKLSNRKLILLQNHNRHVWYITTQTCDFVVLAFMARILETWNPKSKVSFQDYFEKKKKELPYSKYIPPKTAHRAMKICEFFGLKTPSSNKSQYSPEDLTDLYRQIKDRCHEQFQNKSTYQDLIDKSIFNMKVPVGSGSEFTIKAVPFTLKVILGIGDITGKYSITLEEFKLLVSTSSQWKDYPATEAAIIRFREDQEFRNETKKYYKDNDISHNRVNTVFGNLSYIDKESGSDIKIKDSDLALVRKLISEYEINEKPELENPLGQKGGISDTVSKYDVDSCESLFTAIRTKPFLLLAGISGTGKSRIVRKLAQATVTESLQKQYDKEYKGNNFNEERWNLHTPANFELIQVKPNWHNSMDVVGYLSNIPTPHYVFTPFVEFIVRAWQHPSVPFFLCLDEMNLAPVEEYFAEYLSAIESRSFENGVYVTDPIIKPFKEFGTDICKQMVTNLFPEFTANEADSHLATIISHLKNKGLTLPNNLVVIGTVNMDETTFSFSRKVLDRAMSIEMNEVDYDNFLAGTTDDELKKFCKRYKDEELNNKLLNRNIESREVIKDLGTDANLAIDYLKQINALLEGTPFKLGYRAANEALLYLKSAEEFEWGNSRAALDNFTLMKILSRIEGDSTKMKLDPVIDSIKLDKAGVDTESAKKFNGELNLLTALREIIVKELGEFKESEESESNVDTQETGLTMPTSEDGHILSETEGTEKVGEKNTEKKKLNSIYKLDNMIGQLKRDHFVSFWN